ncbi:MAG TPA: hypothetical protein O0X27_02820 [Methanocorpusculum sp.]|nr:hypothetical protein [Methanocorpusculum sp.]
MFGRKKQHELSDDELAAQTLQNCRMSMGQIFQEQVRTTELADDDAFMQGFLDSPEYREAFAAYAKRMGKE